MLRFISLHSRTLLFNRLLRIAFDILPFHPTNISVTLSPVGSALYGRRLDGLPTIQYPAQAYREPHQSYPNSMPSKLGLPKARSSQIMLLHLGLGSATQRAHSPSNILCSIRKKRNHTLALRPPRLAQRIPVLPGLGGPGERGCRLGAVRVPELPFPVSGCALAVRAAACRAAGP